MKFSIKTIYGLQALYEIALHPTIEELKSSEISDAQNIPPKFLEQILTSLKKSGLIKSTRGRSGGYSLSRPAREITLLDIIEALEGKIAFAKSVKKDSALYLALNEAQESFIQSLKKLNLDSLVEAKRKKDKTLAYTI